jgi:hypothetical protein
VVTATAVPATSAPTTSVVFARVSLMCSGFLGTRARDGRAKIGSGVPDGTAWRA